MVERKADVKLSKEEQKIADMEEKIAFKKRALYEANERNRANCAFCNMSFIKKRDWQKCCSDICRYRLRNQNKEKPVAENDPS